MSILFGLCGLGLALGFLLMTRVPLCRAIGGPTDANVSLIVPARDEERNLPRLLNSVSHTRRPPQEVIVVDDASVDRTAAVSAAHGARVLVAAPLGHGWTGKTWACYQGAEIASGDTLLFLDADTWFDLSGLDKVIESFAALNRDQAALSILPFHVTRNRYEELSLFFNLLMAVGAGGFGMLGGGRLFGQSLVISRALYKSVGGHAAVRNHILENFALSRLIESAGSRSVCIGGRHALNMRMFPDGFDQLCEGWTKAFAEGAGGSEGRVLGIAVCWLSALCTAFLLLFAPAPWRIAAISLYACSAMQVWWFARQIGTYRFITCALYPIPLVFFFALFARSLERRVFRRQVSWRGRQL